VGGRHCNSGLKAQKWNTVLKTDVTMRGLVVRTKSREEKLKDKCLREDKMKRLTKKKGKALSRNR